MVAVIAAIACALATSLAFGISAVIEQRIVLASSPAATLGEGTALLLMIAGIFVLAHRAPQLAPQIKTASSGGAAIGATAAGTEHDGD